MTKGKRAALAVGVILALYLVIMLTVNVVGLYQANQYAQQVAASNGVCYLNTGDPLVHGDRVSCWEFHHPWRWAWL